MTADGRVEFGVLGPLRIASGDTELEVTSSQSRVFLALLVLNAGHQVTLYALADAIWGVSLPKNPRRAAQLCAVRVRARLEEIGAADRVVTCPDGYRLDVAAEHTDVGRFRKWLRAADSAAADDDADGELAAVTSALEQWRGDALADVSSDVLQREMAPGLAEQRLSLVERRIDLLLRRENAADLVDELVTLTARHPLRERLWGQLMESLQRCGRRTEALNAFHRYRLRLREEFGIDPSPRLRALHTTILTSRTDAEPAAASVSLPVPRELPSDTAAFAGRAAELSQLDALMPAMDASAGPVVAVVTGTAGVGKSTLVVHWARRNAEEFGDGQLFVNMRGYHPAQAVSPERVLARFLRALGVRGEDIPDDVDERAAMYRSIMDGRRMLVVLDNVNSSDQVRPLLPSSAGSLVLVTSRDVLLSLIVTDGARRINLDLPSITDARKMLARRVGGERLSTEPGAGDDIIAASARLPLAIAIAAARAATNHDSRLATVAAQLKEGLDAFDTASTTTDVRSVFSWSYRALSPEAARLLRLLGLHPGPDLTCAAAASLVGVPPKQADHLLAELARANLLTEHVPGRYALHDLMREYAVELVSANETHAERDLAGRRLLDHYLHTGYAAAIAINPRRTDITLDEMAPAVHPEEPVDRDTAMEWFSSEREVMLAALDWASGAGYDSQVGQLVRVFAGYLERQGFWTQLIGCYQAAIAAAERLGEPIPQARAHRGLGVMYARMSRADDAYRHLARALDLYRDADHLNGQARTETSLALLREQQHRYPEALEHARRALEVRERMDDGAAYADVLNTVGWCHALLGQYELALDHAVRALAKHQEIDNPVGQAATLDTIGYAHHHLGNYAEAIDSYHKAVGASQQLGDRYHTAVSLINIGDCYEAMGDRASCHDAWREAELILDDIQHPAAQQVRDKLRGAAA
ncbi:MAG TPA: BTAD domain-containing putative transcriptional regulator [Stackebrandtia sp.]|uniref:AfsR/SARP family transcriptional regulator n=1 Tax=Stackebrandtia sp. TaxID=2023065 RepID=UPI002D699E0D|nr:BTAD domain-containing putative transcriptional regulator [Stackebrandtia sp.]HZE38382.1 BTAD domain-containing putative transcriptional regulator [Stackebrandtia sp.]